MNKHKMSLKKDWLFLTLATIIGSFIIFTILFGLKIIIDISNYEHSRNNPHKIKLFNENNSLLCTATQNRLSNAQIVSKDDNWSVYGQYFKKDKQLLNIVNCSLTDINIKR